MLTSGVGTVKESQTLQLLNSTDKNACLKASGFQWTASRGCWVLLRELFIWMGRTALVLSLWLLLFSSFDPLPDLHIKHLCQGNNLKPHITISKEQTKCIKVQVLVCAHNDFQNEKSVKKYNKKSLRFEDLSPYLMCLFVRDLFLQIK